MHRFFIPPAWIHGSRVTLRDEVAHQLHTVLRMRPGDRVLLLDNAGREFEVELTEIRRDQVSGEVRAEREASGEPRAQVALYQCLLKKDNFEWVLQKCTELGIARFVPVESQRTVVPASSVSDGKLARWRRILTEAAEQSGRGCVPALDEPHTLAEALRDASQYDVALLPWEGASGHSVRAALKAASRPDAVVPRVAVLIGPEGGFAEEEVGQADEAGARVVTLGPRILRAETAAIAASLLVLDALGELIR